MQKIRLSDPTTKDERLKNKYLKGKAREDIKEEIKLAIQKELYEWVVMQPAERYEKLPLDSRVYLYS